MYGNNPLTPQEVAEILKISKSTVYELIKRKEIKSYKVGKKLRIDPSDIESYKNRNGEKQQSLTMQNTYTDSSLVFGRNNSMPEDKTFIICGQDVALDILGRYLSSHPNGVRALRSYEGSYNGLYLLYRGEVQVATAHMWDGKTGVYNVPFVERMLPGIPSIIYRIAGRMQGFYVPKGNPKSIKSWSDLHRPDITIINREKGSGTRILLDEHLKILGINGQKIKGYTRESTSHHAIASTVARGGADLGIGNEKACLQVQDIEFIPLQKEQYDLIIKKEDCGKPVIKAIIDIINSDIFKMELQGLGGYDISESGNKIAET
jgi:putative molybdopterin biosynthesis protein